MLYLFITLENAFALRNHTYHLNQNNCYYHLLNFSFIYLFIFCNGKHTTFNSTLNYTFLLAAEFKPKIS